MNISGNISCRRHKLAVSTHVLEKFQPCEHLPLISHNNISLIELGVNCFPFLSDEAEFKRLKRVLSETGISVHSIHVPYAGSVPGMGAIDFSHPDESVRQKMIATTLLCWDRLMDLDGRYLVVHPSYGGVEESDRKRRLALCRESLAYIRSGISPAHGGKIAIENLPPRGLASNSMELITLVDSLDRTVFGVCLDVNHGNLKEDIVEATKRYGRLIDTVHLSDNDGLEERHWFPGAGIICWKEWVPAVLSTGYEGPFLYESSQPEGMSDVETVAQIVRDARGLFPI